MFIKMDRVCFSIKCRKVLDDFDFSARKGDAVLADGDALGKRVFLRLIAGKMLPDSGCVLLDGQPAVLSRKTVYLPSKPRLVRHRTLLENLCLPLQLRGFGKSDAALVTREHLRLFGLQMFEDYYPEQLSADIISRAAVAEAGLFPAEVLLLERPTALILPENRPQIHRYLNSLRLDGKTLILVTDDAAEAAQLTERTVMIKSVTSMSKDTDCSVAVHNMNFADF